VPSQLHETLLLLFRNHPGLAPVLLDEALHVELPTYTEARIEAADLTDVQPAEYRTDLVVLLYDERPVLGVIVEVQLGIDDRKRFAWPVYVAGLRARMRCPVCMLVVTADEPVARWAAKAIDLGGSNLFRPLVIGPSAVPEITDGVRAKSEPELAVLSAMTHGRDDDTHKAFRIAAAALAAATGLDPDRMRLYGDMVLRSLSEAVRRSLQMKPFVYEYESAFAREYIAKGKAEGEAHGRAVLLLKLLQLKLGPLPDAVTARVQSASIAELDAWAERVLSATALDEALR
jgi:hypothetical protein